MKNLIYITLIIPFLFGCKSDDDSVEDGQVKTYWLKSYTPSTITAVGQTFFDEQNIRWTFDFQNQTINVELINGEEAIVLESGNYNYRLSSNNCGATNKELIINNAYYGDLRIGNTPGILIIEELCFNDRRLVFEEL
ncbi:MAG: hypothetical protein ACSHXF_10980 [Aquaticitalea sp.]